MLWSTTSNDINEFKQAATLGKLARLHHPPAGLDHLLKGQRLVHGTREAVNEEVLGAAAHHGVADQRNGHLQAESARVSLSLLFLTAGA
jgi:hypothetical protein